MSDGVTKGEARLGGNDEFSTGVQTVPFTARGVLDEQRNELSFR